MSAIVEPFAAIAGIIPCRNILRVPHLRHTNTCLTQRPSSREHGPLPRFQPMRPAMRTRSILPLCCFLMIATIAQNAPVQSPKLLSWSQQIAVREQWLAARHPENAPLMREGGLGMWGLGE